MKEVLLSVEEAAERMHCSTSLVYYKIQKGELRSRRCGRLVHILEQDLEEYLREEDARQQWALEQKRARAARKAARAGKDKGAKDATNGKS